MQRGPSHAAQVIHRAPRDPAAASSTGPYAALRELLAAGPDDSGLLPGCQKALTALRMVGLRGSAAVFMLPRLMKPARDSVGSSPSSAHNKALKQRSPLSMMAPKPSWCAAFMKLPRAQPAASHCSRSGTRMRSWGDTMKASKTGLRVACSRARLTSSREARGSRRSFSCSNRFDCCGYPVLLLVEG